MFALFEGIIDGIENTNDEGENDGAWQPAHLDPEPKSQFSWRFFSIDLGGLAPGKHKLVSRAIDAKGRIQPSSDDDEIVRSRQELKHGDCRKAGGSGDSGCHG